MNTKGKDIDVEIGTKTIINYVTQNNNSSFNSMEVTANIIKDALTF